LQKIKLPVFTFLIFQKEDNFSSVASSGEVLAEILCPALRMTFKMQRNQSKQRGQKN